MLVYLFLAEWTIYREFQYQLSGKGMWPFTMVNNKYCGEVGVFQFTDLHDPDIWMTSKMVSSLFKGRSLMKFS